jgi:transcriptional regulator with XRE-family HTH domain
MVSEGWVFRVKAYQGESLGHFLGKFRRANALSHKSLADHLGIRVEWVMAWESPSRRRNPTSLQLIALSKLVEVEPQQLAEMLPPEPLELKTRLCAACYAEQPFHQAQWQESETEGCAHHHLNLLSMCPVCNTGFRTPALWSDDECCEQCGLFFREMRSHQS